MDIDSVDTKHFVIPPDEDFICVICNSVIVKPHSCKDGHSFCYNCIVHWLKTNNTCPCDRKELTIDALSFNRPLNNFKMKLKVWCVNHHFGGVQEVVDIKKKRKKGYVFADSVNTNKDASMLECNWMGSLSEMESHLANDCEYAEISCDYEGCKTSIPRRRLEEHQEDCKFRPFECPYCNITIQFKSKPAHMKSCDRLKESCELDCGAMIEKRERDEHREVCPMVQVSCSYCAMGCMAKVCRRDFSSHMSESASDHTHLIFQRMIQLAADNDSQTERFKDILADNAALHDKIDHFKVDKLELPIDSSTSDAQIARLNQIESDNSVLLNKVIQLESDKSALLTDLNSCVDRLNQVETDNTDLRSRVLELESHKLALETSAVATRAETNIHWKIAHFVEKFDALGDGKYMFSASTPSIFINEGKYEFKLGIKQNELNISVYIFDATTAGTRDECVSVYPILMYGSSITLEHPSGNLDKAVTLKFPPEDKITSARHGRGSNSFLTIQNCKENFCFPDGSIRITAAVRISVSVPPVLVLTNT